MMIPWPLWVALAAFLIPFVAFLILPALAGMHASDETVVGLGAGVGGFLASVVLALWGAWALFSWLAHGVCTLCGG